MVVKLKKSTLVGIFPKFSTNSGSLSMRKAEMLLIPWPEDRGFVVAS